MRIDDFLGLLASDLGNLAICERSIFSDEAWVLIENHPYDHIVKYNEFREFFGEKFKVTPKNICLTGSGKLGFSLDPDADFRPFNSEESDLDIVVVSSEIFEKFWTILLNAQYSWDLKLWSGHHLNVFRKFVSFKPFKENRITEIKEWNVKMGEIQSQFYVNFEIPNTLNYRFYRDWEAAHAYHCNGIEALRRKHASQ